MGSVTGAVGFVERFAAISIVCLLAGCAATATSGSSAGFGPPARGSGCPNVRIRFQHTDYVSTRTFHGPVAVNGVCPVTVSGQDGIPKETLSIAGLFVTTEIVRPNVMVQMLPVFQGDVPSVTFSLTTKNGIYREEVSYLKSGTFEIDGRSFPSRSYQFTEKAGFGGISYSSIWTFIDNPSDPRSPIYVKIEPGQPANNATNLAYAVSLQFMPDRPTEPNP